MDQKINDGVTRCDVTSSKAYYFELFEYKRAWPDLEVLTLLASREGGTILGHRVA